MRRYRLQIYSEIEELLSNNKKAKYQGQEAPKLIKEN